MPTSVIKKLRGFTLIELLVVITIIGILATFIVASFTSAQAKSRDARRKSDLDALKKALELAKGDSQGGSFYPGCVTAAPCTLNGTNNALTPGLVASSYIKVIPGDPSAPNSSSGTFNYNYVPLPTAVAPGTASSYSLTDCLENGNDPQGTSVASATCGSSRQYVITNP